MGLFRWLRAGGLAAGLLLAAAASLRAGGHPAPDVHFFYELRIERGRLHLLHETRWTDLFAQEVLRTAIDRDGDGAISQAEGMEFARAWAERVVGSFLLEVQGVPVELGEAEVHFGTHLPSAADLARAGMLSAVEPDRASLEAFLGTTWEFRVYLDFEIPLPAAEPIHLDLHESTYGEESEEVRPWTTNAILAYGADGLSFRYGTEPDDPRYLTPHIELALDWSGQGPALFEWRELDNPDAEVRDLLGEIIQGRIGLVLGLLLALVYGMGHALAPGHGKAMVAAYLIGRRGRVRDAFWLGGIVTFTHTFSILAVAILAGLFLRATETRLLQEWLGIASGLGILAIGGWLLIRGGRVLLRGEAAHAAHAHTHAGAGSRHGHLDAAALSQRDRGESGRPCPAEYRHDPDHAGLSPDPAALHAHHGHAHHHGHDHRAPTGLRELFALGITGGMVPCPAAVVVFLWALQNDYPWMATLVVGTFSLGLAIVLVAIGLLMVTSAHTLERLARGQQRLRFVLRVLPLLSAIVIVGVGVLVTLAAWQVGPR
ncbi:MAG: sulfite exporter TauE/SafE family protein [Planctomycetes bacterium]|nr:sulfite exporter TauE/SafE family protein [Planctomycetota bacterium]